jgi:hypothetical protein
MDGESVEDILSDEVDQFLGPEDEEDQQAEPGEDQEDLGISEEGTEEGDDAPVDEDEEELPPIAAPISWDAEAKEHFASLDRATQEIIAKREGERETYLRNKSHEAATVKQQVENEAREIIAKMYDNQVAALQVYSQRFQAQEPDQRLLYTNDPNDVLTYQRQEAAYRASVAQQQELQQQIAQAQRQSSLAREQAHQADVQSDVQRLQEQLPEWFDPSAGPELKQRLSSIGTELGYSSELMSQASSTDIMALKVASEWKAKAEKYDAMIDKINKDKMEVVRAAKGLPKMARPGVKPSKGQVNATAQAQSWERTVKATGREREASFADWAEKSGLM